MTLASSLDICRRAADLSGGAVIVGLSGGKDSLVTLDLCCRTFSRVEACFRYMVRGLDSVEGPAREAARRAGVPLHFVPSPNLSRALRAGFFCEPRFVKTFTFRDLEAKLTAETGISWFAYGEKASDGLKRRLYLRACGGLHEGWRRAYPIWDWRKAEVMAYIKQRRLPQPAMPLGRRQSGGFTLKPAQLSTMKQLYHADYRRVLEVFPYAEAAVHAFERRAEQVSDVPGAENAPEQAPA